MAEITSTTEVFYTLRLTEDEARSLKSLLGATSSRTNEDAGLGGITDALYSVLFDHECPYEFHIVAYNPPF